MRDLDAPHVADRAEHPASVLVELRLIRTHLSNAPGLLADLLRPRSVMPRSTDTISSRSVVPRHPASESTAAVAPLSWTDASTTVATTGSPVTLTATTRLVCS